jgi:hypothetical protein
MKVLGTGDLPNRNDVPSFDESVGNLLSFFRRSSCDRLLSES